MKKLLRLTIRRRLLALSAAGLAFTMLLGGVGLWAVDRLSGARDAITVGMTALKSQMEADMMHDALRADVLAALLAGEHHDAAAMADARSALAEHGQRFQKALQALAASRLDEATRQAAQQLRPALEAYLASAAAVVDLAQHDPAAATARMPSFVTAFSQLEDQMEALSERLEKGAQAQREASEATSRATVQGIVGATVAAAAVLLVFGVVTGRAVVQPLQHAVTLAQAVAGGDLSTRVANGRDDEVGELLAALSTMNEQLARVVGSVRAGSEQLDVGTGEIAAANGDLCRRTETQAAAVQQTAASVEQISATVDQGALTAREAAALAGRASEAATAGHDHVDRVVQTMHRIHEGSRRIAEITSVIDGIAFQTNILALNAAVEAARAGEQGRGFAVVAGEVRALAQRAGAAAREIRTLIGASVDEAEAGSQLAGQAGQSIAGLVAQVRQVSHLIGEISNSSGEQSAGFHQIQQAIAELDSTTQKNAAFVEQTSAAAESLRAQTRALVGAVSAFRLERA